MRLDAATISLVCALALSISGAVLLLATRFRADGRGLKLWALGGFIQATALVFFAYRDIASNFMSITVANTLLGCGTLVILLGCRAFFGHDRIPWTAVGITMLIPVAGYWFVEIDPSVVGRVVSLSLLFGVLSFALGIEVWRDKDEALYLSTRFIGGFYLVMSFLLVLRAAVTLAGTTPENVLDPHGVNLVTLLGNIVGALGHGVFMILLSHQRLIAEWERLASLDSLTGSLNRRAFTDMVDRTMALTRRQQSPMALLLLDIDHFKNVNDRFGHPVGDAVLRMFARTIQSGLRKHDVFGRLGGEEFAVLLPATPSDPAMAVAERLRKSVQEHLMEAATGLPPITVSIGLICDHRSSADLPILIEQADIALYEAKRNGRNQVIGRQIGSHLAEVKPTTESQSGEYVQSFGRSQ